MWVENDVNLEDWGVNLKILWGLVMIKVKWNKYEVAILIYGYYLYELGQYPRDFLIKEISSKLRNNRIDKTMEIDSNYRNYNGISMKFGNIQHLFTNGEKGLKNKSTLECDMFDIFKNDKKEFNIILNEAKKIYQIFLDI